MQDLIAKLGQPLDKPVSNSGQLWGNLVATIGCPWGNLRANWGQFQNRKKNAKKDNEEGTLIEHEILTCRLVSFDKIPKLPVLIIWQFDKSRSTKYWQVLAIANKTVLN